MCCYDYLWPHRFKGEFVDYFFHIYFYFYFFQVFLHTNILLPSLFNIPHGRFAILRKAGTRTVQQFCIHTHTHTYREVRFSPSFGVPFLVRFKQHQIFGVNEFRFYVDWKEFCAKGQHFSSWIIFNFNNGRVRLREWETVLGWVRSCRPLIDLKSKNCGQTNCWHLLGLRQNGENKVCGKKKEAFCHR